MAQQNSESTGVAEAAAAELVNEETKGSLRLMTDIGGPSASGSAAPSAGSGGAGPAAGTSPSRQAVGPASAGSGSIAAGAELGGSLRNQEGNQSTSQLRTPVRSAGIAPKSSYYFGPPPASSAFGTSPVGVIGRDKPREIVRIERDYTSGELCQFHPTFPLELEGRLTPTQFSETINDINVILLEANASGWACFDNMLAVLTLYVTPLLFGSKYKREMAKFTAYIEKVNKELFNPAGLHILHPRHSAFLFMEIEYY